MAYESPFKKDKNNVSNRAVYKGPDTVESVKKQEAQAQPSTSGYVSPFKSAPKQESFDMKTSVQNAKDASKPQTAKKKGWFTKVLDFEHGVAESIANNFIAPIAEPVIQLPGAIKGLAKDSAAAKASQENLRKINENLKQRKGESALTRSNDVIASKKVGLTAGDFWQGGLQTGAGFANFVYGGVIGTIGQAAVDAYHGVTKTKGERKALPGLMGQEAPTVQSSFDQRRAQGMDKSTALGMAVGDIAANVLVVTGLVREVRTAPETFKNLRVFRSTDKTIVKGSDLVKAAAGKEVSPKKAAAIQEIEQSPAYLAMDAKVRSFAKSKGFTVESTKSTRWADMLGITPETGTSITVGKPNFFTGSKTPIGALAPKETTLAPGMTDVPVETSLTAKPPEQAPAIEIPKPTPKERLGEATIDLRDAAKQKQDAQLQLQKASSSIAEAPAENLQAIAPDAKPQVGGWIQDPNGHVYQITDTPDGAFKVKNPTTGVEKVTTLKSLQDNGFMKLKDGAEPPKAEPKPDAIAAATEQLRAAEAAERDARVRQQQAKNDLKVVETPTDGQYTKRGAALRKNTKTGEKFIRLETETLKRKFADKAWTKPEVEGTKPLPEKTFRTFDEFKKFVVEHERVHSEMKQLPKESLGAYETRVNDVALARLSFGKASHVRPLSFDGVITKAIDQLKSGDVVVSKQGTWRLGKEVTPDGAKWRTWEATDLKTGKDVKVDQRQMIAQKMGVIVKRMENMPGTGERPGGERTSSIPGGTATVKESGKVIRVTQKEYESIIKREESQPVDTRVEGGQLTNRISPNAEQVRYEIVKEEGNLRKQNSILPEESSADYQARIKEEARQNVVHKIQKVKVQREYAADMEKAGEQVKVRIEKSATETPKVKGEAKPVEAKITIRESKRGFRKLNKMREWLKGKMNPYSKLSESQKKVFLEDMRVRTRGVYEANASIEGNPLADIPKRDQWQAVKDYQAGRPSPYRAVIKEMFDFLHGETKRLGLEVEYRKDYLPQRWADTEKKIKTAAVNKLVDENGMTRQAAQDYVDGKLTLDPEQASRMKLNPSFTHERVFSSYEEGMKYGLTPATTSPLEMYAMYVDELASTNANKLFRDRLLKEGMMKDASSSPQGWVSVDAFQRGMYAPKEVAYILNGRYAKLNDILRVTSSASRYGIEIALSAGIPFTPMNYLSMTYTTLGLLRGDVKVLNSFFRSFSDTAGKRWLNEPVQKTALIELIDRNINLTQQVGNVSSMFSKFSTAAKAKNWGSMMSTIWEKAWNKKTFESFLPQYQLDSYIRMRDSFIKEGIDPTIAKDYAAESMLKVFGKEADTGRTKTTEAVLSSIFFAPRFRESMVNIVGNAIQAFGTKRFSVVDGIKIENPVYRASRHLATGIVTWYALNNLLNYKLNGNFMWDNPEGKEMKLRVPLPNGRIGYVDILPSIATLPRNMFVGTKEMLAGDAAKAARAYSAALSMPMRIGMNLITNRDNFGKPIYLSAIEAARTKQTPDDTAAAIMKYAQFVIRQINHPYVQGAWDLYMGTDENGKPTQMDTVLSKMLEAPATFTDKTKEQQAIAYNAVDDLVRSLAFYMPEHQPEVIKAELMKYPKEIRDIMLSSGAWQSTNLKVGEYNLTDAELKKWKAGPHPVKLIKTASSKIDTSEDNIFFYTEGPLKGKEKALWERIGLTVAAFSKDPKNTFKAVTGQERIRKFRRGIVVLERKNDIRKRLGVDDKSLQVDHILPIAFGGDNTTQNLQAVSIAYNQRKGVADNYVLDLYESGKIGEKEAIRMATDPTLWEKVYREFTPEQLKKYTYGE
jgi:hypothetical protein